MSQIGCITTKIEEKKKLVKTCGRKHETYVASNSLKHRVTQKSARKPLSDDILSGHADLGTVTFWDFCPDIKIQLPAKFR